VAGSHEWGRDGSGDGSDRGKRCIKIKPARREAPYRVVGGRRSHGGYTALHVAAMNSRHDVIELLTVVYKADPDATDFAGRKPIYYLAAVHDTNDRRSFAHLRRFDTTHCSRIPGSTIKLAHGPILDYPA